MRKSLLALFTVFAGSGCATQQTYIGSITSCEGDPIAGADVEAWKNQWIPFHLPLKLGEAKTDKFGAFVLSTEKTASFFVFSGQKIEFSSHPKELESKCAQ